MFDVTTKLAATAVALGAAILLASGCESSCRIHRSALCESLPTEPITSFTVATTTGEDKSDAEIFACFTLKSRGGEFCFEMATSGNDFERHRTDVFDIPFAVDAGDLNGFFIENQGGAVFGNNEWEIAGLTLEANTPSGSFVIYDEPAITCGNEIDTAQVYRPMRCAW